MGLVRNSRIALAAAGVLALGGTAVAVPPVEGAPMPVVARFTLDDGVLGLGPGGVLDIDDTHRVAGPDGTVGWELTSGWDTTGLPAGPARGDGVLWSLTGVEGPGTLRVYEPGGAHEKPAVRFDSADGLPDGYDLPAGGRGKTRWAFDTAGTYQLTFTAQTETETGPLSAETRCTVRVGDAVEVAQGPATPPLSPPADTVPPSPAALVAGAPADAGEGRRPTPTSPAGAGPALTARRATTTGEPVETAKKVLDQGHIDIAARLVDGDLQIHVKDGTVPGRTTWREPSSVVLHVKPEAKKTVPAAEAFSFLGKAGDPVWLLDQVQQPGLLWPGWSTENMPAGATTGDVEFRLVRADGPGNFALYNYDGLSGATIRFNSGDGVPDTFGVPQNTHAHGGWAFSKEGVYRLTFTMAGKLADGTKVSDTETLTFAVGATDPHAIPVGSSTGGSTSGASTGGTEPGSTGSATDSSGTTGGNVSGGTADGTSGGSSGRGAMASTGVGSTLLLGGAAAVLAALGAGFLHVTRRRAA
ncbi:TIGR03773 family transporter-associated surface protein [Streptomyces sp. NPDC101194]|uniref:TIGR03773 family transporter-associated surface protein n=1 Tax=Streptomyces sp. NPDC101194 TaxID=3366127 RepID=UPI00382BD5F5